MNGEKRELPVQGFQQVGPTRDRDVGRLARLEAFQSERPDEEAIFTLDFQPSNISAANHRVAVQANDVRIDQMEQDQLLRPLQQESLQWMLVDWFPIDFDEVVHSRKSFPRRM